MMADGVCGTRFSTSELPLIGGAFGVTIPEVEHGVDIPRTTGVLAPIVGVPGMTGVVVPSDKKRGWQGVAGQPAFAVAPNKERL